MQRPSPSRKPSVESGRTLADLHLPHTYLTPTLRFAGKSAWLRPIAWVFSYVCVVTWDWL